MCNSRNHILQLTDLLTGRSAAVRIDPEDASLELRAILEKFLKNTPVSGLIGERRATQESAERLQDMQDYVYISSDSGLLHDMFDGVAFKQDGAPIGLDEVPDAQSARVGDTPVALIDIAIDRLGVGYDRNWAGFHKRRWDRHASAFEEFVSEVLSAMYLEGETDEIMRLDTKERRLKFVRAIAKRIWHSDFENYSRFVGECLVYKTGDETLINIVNGAGGICSEKVQALKFITDQYGIPSEFVLAGAGAREPVPEDRLRELLTTFDFRFAKRYMRYWQHVALLYTVDGSNVLVDVTNGNIPFLFQEDAASRFLGYENKQPVNVRMAVRGEDFYYHRVSQDIPEKLYFAMEGWIQDVDLIQVFDNELGLYISEDFFVTPVVYRTEKELGDLKRQYAQVCGGAGLTFAISDEWNLETVLGERLAEQKPSIAEKILSARSRLVERYDECHGGGHEAGLVIMGLRGQSENVPIA